MRLLLFCFSTSSVEQLRGIKNTTEEIKENLETSDYLLKGMKSWWGTVAQLFTSPPSSSSSRGRRHAGHVDADGKREQGKKQPEKKSSSSSSKDRGGGGGGGGWWGWSGKQSLEKERGKASRGMSGVEGGGEEEDLRRRERMMQLSIHRASDFDSQLEGDLQKLSTMVSEEERKGKKRAA